MPFKLNEILFHIDWDSSFGEVRLRYDKQVNSPYDLASLSQTIPQPEHLESEEVEPTPFFSQTGTFKVVPDLGKSGLYLIRLRPNYRLKSLLVEPEEIVVDLYANKNDSITYSFYNPTQRASFVVTGQLVEDIDGFYRKLTAYPADPVWRQSLVRRSLAAFEGVEDEGAAGRHPSYMTADQIADYMQVEVKTVRKWTSEGRIPHSKLGSVVRYRKEEIDAAIKAGSLKAKSKAFAKKKQVPDSSQKSLKKS